MNNNIIKSYIFQKYDNIYIYIKETIQIAYQSKWDNDSIRNKSYIWMSKLHNFPNKNIMSN